jgi:hypothetical protein
MPKISSYEVESEKETPSGMKRKYKSGTLSKDNGKADLMVASDDRPNLYKYSDDKAAEKDYELFKSEAEMGMRKGGYVRSADGIAKRGKTRGRMV